MMKIEIERKSKVLDVHNLENMVIHAIRAIVEDIFSKQGLYSWKMKDEVRPFVDAHIEEKLKGIDWSELIDQAANRKIAELLLKK